MYEGGIAKQRWSISDTAEYGDYTTGPFVIDASVKTRMQEALGSIRSGEWAQRFIADQDAGAPDFAALRAKEQAHPIEEVGARVRKMMPWIASGDTDYTEGSAAR